MAAAARRRVTVGGSYRAAASRRRQCKGRVARDGNDVLTKAQAASHETGVVSCKAHSSACSGHGETLVLGVAC